MTFSNKKGCARKLIHKQCSGNGYMDNPTLAKGLKLFIMFKLLIDQITESNISVCFLIKIAHPNLVYP